MVYPGTDPESESSHEIIANRVISTSVLLDLEVALQNCCSNSDAHKHVMRTFSARPF